MEVEIPRKKPRGRLKKAWTKNIVEDMCEWNVLEEDDYDRVRWRPLIKSQNHEPEKKTQNGGRQK